MNNLITTLLVAIAVGGSVFFLVRGFQLRSGYRALTQLERTRATLVEAKERAEKLPPRERLTAYLKRQGYDGDLFPFVAAMAFLYLLLTVVLHIIGVEYTLGALVALPGSFALSWGVARWAAARRRRRFNEQLIELLETLASQIEAGNGAQKALSTVVPNMQEPIQAEMNRVLDAQMASKDLVASMKDLEVRYPSRAMGLFIAALEIDQDAGQAIGPALHQAAELLKKDFALAAEANAEISQTRGEFFAVIGILGGIAGSMLLSKDPATHSAYTSFFGMVLVGGGLLNVAWGIFRFLRLLNEARGDM